MIAETPSVSDRPACATCRFWRRRRVADEHDSWGQCRRMPPTLPELTDDKLVVAGVWPFTEEQDWCGEWQEVVP